MLRKTIVKLVAALSASLAPQAVHAEAFSSAVAKNGGTAISHAMSFGNSRSIANASADGGYAKADQTSYGLQGGFAEGVTTANTINGRSEATGVSNACGPSSVSRLHTTAASYYGSARASGSSNAEDFGTSIVQSTALSHKGDAMSSACGSARHGLSIVEGLADSFGAKAISRSTGTAFGAPGGFTRARSRGIAVSHDIPVNAYSQSNARAADGGCAESFASDIRYGR